jgi:hypothetical protein
VLDRESTFADETIVTLLKEKFIPVAIDQWFTRRQQDTEGDFWRQLAGQSPRNDFEQTTQGLFIADASGKLIAFNNNRGPERVRNQLLEAIKDYRHPVDAKPIERETVDPRFATKLPDGAIVVRVAARVEAGYQETSDKFRKIFQNATSRDNLWITADEIAELQQDRFPEDLARRIERFHLLDNTRGEPSAWSNGDIQSSKWTITAGEIRGTAKLESKDSKRGFEPEITGELTFDDSGKVKSLHMIARGNYWGSSAYTLEAPSGKFPLVVSFTLADGKDIADPLPPHASRGWPDGYIRPRQ